MFFNKTGHTYIGSEVQLRDYGGSLSVQIYERCSKVSEIDRIFQMFIMPDFSIDLLVEFSLYTDEC